MTSTGSLSGSGILSPDSFSLIHSREVSDSSESYSSFELSSDDPSSEDEIVWSLSETDSGGESSSPVFIRSQGALSPATFSDDDVVVLSRPHTVTARYQSLTAPGSVEALANTLSNLNVSPRKAKPKKKSAPVAGASTGKPTASTSSKKGKAAPSTSATVAKQSVKAKKRARKPRTAAQSTAEAVRVPVAKPDDTRSIVDDVSEAGESAAYEEAVQYVNDILANPAPTANSNLKLLHALIIELGVAPAAQVSSLGAAVEVLPRSLRAARALLKSRVFVNVVDYLAVRHKGLGALQSVMHPNRKALANSIRSDRKKMPAKEVKKSGLGVFLVTCYR